MTLPNIDINLCYDRLEGNYYFCSCNPAAMPGLVAFCLAKLDEDRISSQVSARMCVDEFVERFCEPFNDWVTMNNGIYGWVEQNIKNVFGGINRYIYDFSNKLASGGSFGSEFYSMVIYDGVLVCGRVWDGMVALVRDGELFKLFNENETFPVKMGQSNSLEVEFVTLELKENDVLIVYEDKNCWFDLERAVNDHYIADINAIAVDSKESGMIQGLNPLVFKNSLAVVWVREDVIFLDETEAINE